MSVMAEGVSRYYRQYVTVRPNLVPEIRRGVRSQLLRWGCAVVATPVEMCVSELLTNVVRHARSPECVLLLHAQDGRVHAVVSDADPDLPVVREPDFFAESGRGMFLISNTASDWGAVRTPAGKDVWITLELAPSSSPV